MIDDHVLLLSTNWWWGSTMLCDRGYGDVGVDVTKSLLLGSDLYMILLDPWRMILTFNGYWELGSHIFRFGTQEVRKLFDRKNFNFFEISTVKNLNSKYVTVKKFKVLKSSIRCVRSITCNTGIMKLICNCSNSL